MFKKCKKCGQVIYALKGNNTVTCCETEMNDIVPNSVDASFEKHVPEYSLEGDKVIVTVNHVMEEDHFIEWIAIENDKEFFVRKLKPNDEPKAIFNYIPNATIYSYCNKHSLWKKNLHI